MNDTSATDAATLDPPGSIVVLGTTAIGIEAALYGRFLGYDVRLLAGQDVWQSRDWAAESLQRIGPPFQDDWLARNWLAGRELAGVWQEAMPMMPDRCMSSLAFSALQAQRETGVQALPNTIEQWIEEGLYALTQTDLLRGRVFANTFVDSVEMVSVELDGEEDLEEDDEELPPDFLLHLSGETDSLEDVDTLKCECLIIADLESEWLWANSKPPADYYFEIGADSGGGEVPTTQDASEWLRLGFRQIAELYAELAGRENLDLYRPERI
ncbi:hypothetical protein SAMN06265222_12376 [Neorhodopirellula lusitana]|uniref:Uncharacterized protein n=1 Tax=Neorhodopirellula lusitana TaxID=445327 RepID=A0ABY1QRZ3_9BACT|nr:hypothetical protein [Neorhodopirellula lusitana]SMP77686.1 hypothetical protein SAMN06265222_12376 [Neorhodopirellula lusitana]